MPPVLERKRKSSIIDQAFVDYSIELDARMKQDAVQMLEIKTLYVEAGVNEYMGSDGTKVAVIFPRPKIAPAAEDLAKIEQAIGKTAFGQLFDRVVIWKAVQSCRDVASRILKGVKLQKFFELAEKECPAQVRFTH
jgi:hypothetical protein